MNPDIEIVARYTTMTPDFDGFFAPDRAQQILETYGQGADVVYHAAGGAGLGLFEAAKTHSEGGTKVWAIGADKDQYPIVDPSVQEFILTSMVKSIDVAVYDITRARTEGAFEPGNTVYDLSVDVVGYATNGGFIDDIVDQLEDFKAQIIAGDIVLPTEP